jgi:tRNA 2-thiouridine synthesizing protein C
MKRVLFLVRSAPYGSATIAESVRACLGFTTMPLELDYVLMDDAAWALALNQRPAAIGAAPVLELIGNLADSGVRLHVDAAALSERGLRLEGVEPAFAPLDTDALADLIAGADAVLTYE